MRATPPFELFGTAHLFTVALSLGASLVFALWARRLTARAQQRVAVVMALLLVAYRTGWIVDRWLHHGDPLRLLIPFHICAIMFYLCAWVLWRRDYRVYEVVWFWGLAGTLTAMLTPDLAPGFPHPEFLGYFLSHAALIAALLYATFVYRFRPTPRSILRAWIATLVYAALLLPLNFLLGTNHMYLREKPAGATPLDWLGPWPWYLVSGALLAPLVFALWYLPFALASMLERRRGLPPMRPEISSGPPPAPAKRPAAPR